MKKTILLFGGLLVIVAIGFTSCKKEEEPAPVATTTPPTLYERVGGTKKVTDPNNSSVMIEQGRLTLRSVVDSAINVIAADSRLAKFFPVLFAELGSGNTTGLTALSKNFTDFMCFATGSKNYSYTGLSMKNAHDPAANNRMGEKAANADFDNFVGDIGVALGQNGVTDQKLINDLVALLETTRADIVQK